MSIFFKGLPAAASPKRGITVDKDGLTVSNHIVLDPGIAVLDVSDYVYVTADHAEINSSVTYSGSLKYSTSEFKVTEFTFDITKNVYHDIILTFEFFAPYTYEFGFEVAPLSYYIVDIPGIISLGPCAEARYWCGLRGRRLLDRHRRVQLQVRHPASTSASRPRLSSTRILRPP